MRILVPTLLLSLMAATPLMGGQETVPGKGSKYSTADIVVVNRCDAAVSVSLNGSTPSILEPNGSLVYGVTFKQKNTTVNLAASIDLGSGIADTTAATLTVHPGEIVETEITCMTTDTGVTLAITTLSSKWR